MIRVHLRGTFNSPGAATRMTEPWGLDELAGQVERSFPAALGQQR